MNGRIIAHLVQIWLVLDFFGPSRGADPKTGSSGSTLTTTIFTQAFLGLVIAALLFPDTPAVAYASANLSLSTVLIAIGALPSTAWLLRARTDTVLLQTAPVARWQVALAYVVHRGFFLSLTTIGIALPPAILMIWLCGHRLSTLPSYLLAALLSAGSLTLALELGAKSALRFLGPERGQLLAGTLRAGLLGGGLVAFASCLSRLKGSVADLPFPTQLTAAWPPYLLAQWIVSGTWRPFLLVVLAIAALMVAGMLFAAPARATMPRRRHGPLLNLTTWLAGSPRQRGIAAFVATMLYRSPSLRMRLLPLLGIPVAFVWLSLRQVDPRARLDYLAFFLQLPTVYLPFLVAFLANSDQPRVGWTFATSPGLQLAEIQRATRIALVTHVLIPIYLLSLPMVLANSAELGVATLLCLSSFAIAILVTAQAARSIAHVPFSQDREDRDGGLQFDQVLAYGLGLTLVAIGLSRGLQTWFGPIIALILAALALWTLRNHKHD